MRPIWKGHITFGLVMVPVVLYSGEAPQSEIDLDMLDSRDHSRIRYQRVNEKTGKEVPWKSIVKGYQYEDGKYVVLTPEDFKAAADGAVKGVELMEFVPIDSIDPVLFEKPYFLEPSKDGKKGYVLLRETLKQMKLVGVARVVIQTRQHLAAVMPQGDMLTLLTMRFPEEVREATEFKIPHGNTGRSKVSAAELKMAEMLVESMKSKWDPHRHHDEYRQSLEKFIKQKTSGKGKKFTPVADEETGPETYNIMDLLRKSVEKKPRGSETRKSGRSTSPAGKVSARRRAG